MNILIKGDLNDMGFIQKIKEFFRIKNVKKIDAPKEVIEINDMGEKFIQFNLYSSVKIILLYWRIKIFKVYYKKKKKRKKWN